MNARIEEHMARIRAMSAPISALKPDSVEKLVRILASGATVALDAQMPAGNITLVKADSSGAMLVIVGSREVLDAFAQKHGLERVEYEH